MPIFRAYWVHNLIKPETHRFYSARVRFSRPNPKVYACINRLELQIYSPFSRNKRHEYICNFHFLGYFAPMQSKPKINFSPQIDFSYEQALWQNGVRHIAGVDEAGRGPWAGPVVAGAVIFPPHFRAEFLTILNDSKKLSAKKRAYLFDEIIKNCDYAIGVASVKEIDDINILEASMLAMHRAVNGLNASAEYALIDGNKIPTQLNIDAQAIVKGDGRSFSIAAASIIAKVTRDRLMQKLHIQYPHYSWHTNAGYGTKAHQTGLAEFGITPHHRLTFKPIKKLIPKSEQK